MIKSAVKKFPVLDNSLVQAIIAFIIGGMVFFLIGLFVETTGIVNVIYAAIGQNYSAPVWSNFLILLLVGALFYVSASLIAFTVVILAMRLLGLKAPWTAMYRMLVVAFVWYFVVMSVFPKLSVAPNRPMSDIQALLGYVVPVLLGGLPYSFGWLWASRPLDRPARKA